MPTTTVLINPSTTSANFVPNTIGTYGGCTPGCVVDATSVTVSQRGFYQTISDYDPSLLGGIVVTGTWMFQNGADNMQVVTRADGVVSGYYGQVNTGLDFSCYSSQCFIATLSGGSPTNIASASFSMSANVVYNFMVIDTGTNVLLAMGTGSTWTMSLSAVTSMRTCANKIVFFNRECGNGLPGSVITGITVAQLAPLSRGLDKTPDPRPATCTNSLTSSISVSTSFSGSVSSTISLTSSTSPTLSLTATTSSSVTPTISITASISPSNWLSPGLPTTTVLVNPSTTSVNFVPNTSGTYGGCSPGVSVGGSSVTISQRGFYQTINDFDPAALGGIVVSGTWMFQTSVDNMQVVTRSDGVVSGYYGQVATGVDFSCYATQCFIAILSGGNPSYIASAGFSMSVNVAYNFLVIDTGANVLLAMGTGTTWTLILTAVTPVRNCLNKIVFFNRECTTGVPGSVVSGITVALLAPLSRPLDVQPAAFPCSPSTSPTISVTGTRSPTSSVSPSLSASGTPVVSPTRSVTPTISVTATNTASPSPTISITATVSPSAYLHPDMPTVSVLVSPSSTSSKFQADNTNPYGCSPAGSITISGGIVTFKYRSLYKSVASYDPIALGGIVVSGSWTFKNNQDTMQIITRSDGVATSYYNEPNSGVEFECYFALCYIGVLNGAVVQTLVSMSFSPSINVAYPFQVIDTGSDVFFAIKVSGVWQTLSTTTSYHGAVSKVVLTNRECTYGSPGGQLTGLTVAQMGLAGSITPTVSLSLSITATISPSLPPTTSISASQPPSISISSSTSNIASHSPTQTASASQPPSQTQTASSSSSATVTDTPSRSQTPTPSSSSSATVTDTPSRSQPPTPSSSSSATVTDTPSRSQPSTPSSSSSATVTDTPSGSQPPSQSQTAVGSDTQTPSVTPTKSPTYAVTWAASQTTLAAGDTCTITATLANGQVAPFAFTITWSHSGTASSYTSSVNPFKCIISTGTSSCSFTVTNIMTSGSDSLTVYAISAAVGTNNYQFTPISQTLHLYAVVPSATASVTSTGTRTGSVTASTTSSSSRSSTQTRTVTFTPTRQASESRSGSQTRTVSKTYSQSRSSSASVSPTSTPVIGAMVSIVQDTQQLAGGLTGHLTCVLTTGPLTIDIVVSFNLGGTTGIVRGVDYISTPATGSTVIIPAGSTQAVISVQAASSPPNCASVAAGQCKLRVTFTTVTHATFVSGTNTSPQFFLN